MYNKPFTYEYLAKCRVGGAEQSLVLQWSLDEATLTGVEALTRGADRVKTEGEALRRGGIGRYICIGL